MLKHGSTGSFSFGFVKNSDSAHDLALKDLEKYSALKVNFYLKNKGGTVTIKNANTDEVYKRFDVAANEVTPVEINSYEAASNKD